VAGVTVTFAVTAGGGAVSPSTVVTNASGIATLTSWTLGTTAGANTVTASASGLTGSPVTFNATGTAGAATQLAITTQPNGAVTGEVFTTQPIVSIRDVNGNQTTSTAAVTAAIFSGGGTLAGTVTVNAVNGVATFTNLLITGTGNHTIRFTSGALTNATSSVFNVAAGPPTQLAITTQPGGAGNTAPFANQPVIAIRDAGGFQTTSTAAVTAAVFSGSGTLTGTVTVNAVNGIATFGDLTLTGTGAHTLRFTSTGLTSATSASFTITAGPATTIAAQSPLSQSATVSTAVGAPPAVLVTDVSGNPVSGVSVTFAVTGGGGTIAPTTTIVTNAVGVAALTSWTVGSAAGENTVTATSSGLTGSPITFTATGTAELNLQYAAQRVPARDAQRVPTRDLQRDERRTAWAQRDRVGGVR
jgi:trimeric autotransporter adhesin